MLIRVSSFFANYSVELRIILWNHSGSTFFCCIMYYLTLHHVKTIRVFEYFLWMSITSILYFITKILRIEYS